MRKFAAARLEIFVEIDNVRDAEHARQVVITALTADLLPTSYSAGVARLTFHAPRVDITYINVAEKTAQARENHTAETARLNEKYNANAMVEDVCGGWFAD